MDELGRPVVVGRETVPGGGGPDVYVARPTPELTLDPTFGGDGTVVDRVDTENLAEAVAVSDQGAPVLFGTTKTTQFLSACDPLPL